MEIIGTIQQKLEPQSGTSNKGTWIKQDFIIETLEKYPRTVCLTNWQNKISMEEFHEGELIKAMVNIESKAYKDKWYTDVKVWSMEKIKTVENSQNEWNKEKEDIEIADNDLPF